MPAVNPGISVSRVGGNAQIKAMKKVAGSLKLLYSQYRELQSFAQFGSDLDADTKERLALGERIVEILKQDKNSPMSVELQVAVIFATVNGYLKNVEVRDVKRYEKELCVFLKNKYDDLLSDIKTTGDLSKENTAVLEKALDEFSQNFS